MMMSSTTAGTQLQREKIHLEGEVMDHQASYQ